MNYEKYWLQAQDAGVFNNPVWKAFDDRPFDNFLNVYRWASVYTLIVEIAEWAEDSGEGAAGLISDLLKVWIFNEWDQSDISGTSGA